ncbi:LamG-like jellyroll fold domain-containing protein [Phytohabitans rumicis]|uniref:LamG-like jellyroll fold domain-containing protein n=1 Tax=Phytohabitans rumicis TaxID=1076125 RepID=UPI001FE5A277|nr:LamG-like jellyroll fold domain-containing protein [Phytohabitans rumicis]
MDGTAPLPTGWTHVAVTKSATTGTLYVNGEPVGTNPNLTLSPSDLNGGDTANNWIGRSQYADPLLDATVDDFHIYDRALAPAELGALLSAPGNGNVAAYHFDETAGTTAADSSGNERHATVTTRVDVPRVPQLDGLASADPSTRTVRVIFGGGDGDIQLKVAGLAALPHFGGKANVQIFATEWTGTDGVSDGPAPLFEGTYRVHEGAISVPVSGIEDSAAYLAVIRPERQAPRFPGPVRRYEAEAAAGRSAVVADPLASENRYVRANRLDFTVTAPTAGAYALDLRYTNPTGAPVHGVVTVNGRRQTIDLPPTATAAPFSTNRLHADLTRGRNRISLRLGPGTVGVDHIDVTPFRTRVEAEHGQWSGANLVTVDMGEGNFFAPYVSGDAYVANLSQPDSTLRVPVTVPSAGRYRLKIGYSTAGTEEERRAQIKAGHLLRVDDGPWQPVWYDPTQFRQMIRQTTAVVDLPAGTSTLTFAKATQPGVVDVDYVDVLLAP